MFAKIASLLLAAAALTGAVIYAQNQAEKGKKPKPVFDTSKSGTPTPIEEEPKAKPEAKPESQGNSAEAANPQQNPEKPQKKKKQKKIMPSSKAAFPD